MVNTSSRWKRYDSNAIDRMVRVEKIRFENCLKNRFHNCSKKSKLVDLNCAEVCIGCFVNYEPASYTSSQRVTELSYSASRLRTENVVRGWKLVQKSLPRILEYGREEGILKQRVASLNVTGVVVDGTEDAKNVRDQRIDDKVNLPTNDITVMHEAIPFLPVPVALLCLTFNILLPGFGTILSGVCGLCMGQPRINFKEGRKLMTLLVNFLVGISQFFTITFLFVGWFWSISWGILIIIHSMQYREALQQRRQEAVATAAIEALTKDSILHRRDVKTLVKSRKNQSNK